VRAPEGQHYRALFGFPDLPIDMCTASAKVGHAKSSRYGANFELMCKSLQRDVTIHGIKEQGERGEGHARSACLSTQVAEKARES
jgi:hypothetical protein